MADQETMQEDRTESATGKRIEEARKRGQVPRSPELSAAAVTLAGGAGLWFAGAALSDQLVVLMRDALVVDRVELLDPSVATGLFASSMINAAVACAPVLGLTFVAAVLAPMTLSGWNFSGEAIGFKFERMSLLAGLQRMASLRGFVELGKAFAKFLWVAAIAWIVLRNEQAEIMHLGQEPVSQALGHAAKLCGSALLALGAAMLMIAALDVPWQLWQYHRDLRMTKDEVRQENKESEGSPEVKGRIRAAQQAMARRRMMSDVATATVVITNPTHFAVALRYDDKRSSAPVVVAKGVDDVAAKIREIAGLNSVPTVEAPPLARALYRAVDIGSEIPAALYVSVAQVLTYVFQLRTARKTGEAPPGTADYRSVR